MAFYIVYQRTRENLVTTTPAGIGSARVFRGGIAFDGDFLWVYDQGGFLCQLRRNTYVEVKAVAVDRVLDGIVFDGEYLWCALGGNNGIGQFTREGQRLNNTGGITSSSLTGITHDGTYLWAHHFDAVGGGSKVVQVEYQPSAGFVIVDTFTTTDPLSGLAFDGEYLVGLALNGGRRDLCFYTREGILVKKTLGEAAGGDATGLAFDGDFFYTMLGV